MTTSRNAPPTRRLLLPVAAAALVLAGLSGPAAPVASATSVTTGGSPAAASPGRAGPVVLPAPTGPHAVATRTIYPVDRDRQDPWVRKPTPRRLAVTLAYPTERPGTRPARYLTRAESRAFLRFQEEEQGAPVPEDLPRGILSRTEVGAAAGGPVDRAAGGRPLVVLSPGFSLPRATLMFLATDLASHGYVVALVDHAHESSGLSLPGGRFVRCAACDTDDVASVARGRTADLSFLLDRLLRRGGPWRGVVDPRRVAVAGHSIGGNAAVSMMRTDRRVDAAIDLDGTLFDPVRRPLTGPVMFMGTDDLHRPRGEDRTWPRAWRRLDGPRTWVTVAGSTHGSFTDGPLLVEQLVPSAPGPELSGEDGVRLTRTYVLAFLDRHLRGRDEPLLDGPDPAYPEVSHHDPGR